MTRTQYSAPRPKGVAILMVVVIIAGMMALAAPFVLSMILHQRSARNDLYAMQARAGAEAAQAHALASLYRNTIRMNPNDTSPEVTTLSNLKVSMDFPSPAREFNKLNVSVMNPGGLLWSAKVEDEQAKVNLYSAPPALLGNLMASAILTETVPKGGNQLAVDDAKMFPVDGGLVCLNGEPDPLPYLGVKGNVIFLKDGVTMEHIEGALVYDGRARKICDYKFSRRGANFLPFRSIYEMKMALNPVPGEALQPEEFARLERLVTIQSGIDGPIWGHMERPKEQGTGQVGGFNVENGVGFTPGALIRVVQDGIPQNYERVRRVVPHRGDGGAFVELNNPIDVSNTGNDNRYIQPALLHPININTASKEVVEAVFTGVCLYADKEAIRRPTARILADLLLKPGVVYSDETQLKKALDDAHTRGILTSTQRDALYINATEPGSHKLRTSTVPFCFFSFGSFTIEGTGVVNSENGVQFARNTLRQLVTLPTPWPGRFNVEYQAGFQNLIDQGLGSRVVTFPYPMSIERNKKNGLLKLPSYNSGNVRLDVGESGSMLGKTGVIEESLWHCDDENDPGYRQDGYDMNKRQPFYVPYGGNGGGNRPGRNRGGRNNRPMLVAGGNNNNNNNNNQNQQLTNPANGNQTAARPTGVEMWYRPTGGGQCVFYDESLEDDRNRVTFSYEPGAQPKAGLVVQIFDAGLECTDVQTKDWTHMKRPPVKFLYPFQMDGGEWYHVAASWKTGGINGQEIRVDAQPVPPHDQIYFKPGAKLAQGISIDDTSLELEADDPDFESYFPKAGAIQIGEEIIEYRQRTGNSFQQLSRGTRLSTATKHDDGEWAVPFGFSIGLGQDLPVGGATLTERLEKANAMSRCRIELPPNQAQPFVLDSVTNKIPVNDCSDFPPSGFVYISGELIYYPKRTATAFLNVVRAQSNRGRTPPARNLNNGSHVQLASIEISDSSQYDPYGIVQIDDDQNDKIVEWIAYNDKQVINGKHYLIANPAGTGAPGYHVGPTNQYKPGGPNDTLGSFRHHFGICSQSFGRDSSHDKKAKVIPVISMQGPHCGNQRSPYGDNGISEVSIVEHGTTNSELRWVKQAYIQMSPNWVSTNPQGGCPVRWADWSMIYYVGLNDFVSRRYPQQTSRFLKWPSGELPDTVNAKRVVGADRNGDGKLRGHVDEIRVNVFNTYGARIAMTTSGKGISSGDEAILIENHDAWPRNGGGGNANVNWPTTGGLIRIEDELIFYKTSNPATFQYYSDVLPKLQDKANHEARNPCPPPQGVMELHPNDNNEQRTGVSLNQCMRGVLGTKAAEHPPGAKIMLLDAMPVSLLTSPMHGGVDSFSVKDGHGFAPEGYVWIGQEVISYLENNGNNFTGCRFFRGRFGTYEQDHDAEEIVRSLPFRYWDREAKLYDGEGLAHVQAGYSASDAVWDGVELKITGTEERPGPPAHVKPRVLLRFDQKPSWDADVTNQEGGLFEFRDRQGVMSLKGGRFGGVRADEIEMRVYWEFKRGAFIPGHDWKRTFSIEKMRATYSTPLLMRRLDEVEKR